MPFRSKANKEERKNWFKHRLRLFREATQCALRNQVFDYNISTILWLVFISKGDREYFKLPKYEMLDNNITMVWEEVEKREGADDDYYRNTVIPLKIEEYVNCLNRISIKKEFTLTLRIDSDDLIDPLYLNLILSISDKISRDKNFHRAYLYFPCGLTYNLKTSQIAPRIWPESSFLSCIERNEGKLKTVWFMPHDTISQIEQLYPITTNVPMWVTLVGHGNMINNMGEYLSVLRNCHYPFISDKVEIRY